MCKKGEGKVDGTMVFFFTVSIECICKKESERVRGCMQKPFGSRSEFDTSQMGRSRSIAQCFPTSYLHDLPLLTT